MTVYDSYGYPLADYGVAGIDDAIVGVVVLVAGLTAKGVQASRAKTAAAVAKAEAAGIPNASDLPAYTKRVMRWSPKKRSRRLKRYQARLKRRKNDQKLRTKVTVLRAVIKLERGATSTTEVASSVAADNAADMLAPVPQATTPAWLLPVGVGVGVLGIGLLLLRSRSGAAAGYPARQNGRRRRRRPWRRR